jgi:hypothetical protein
MYDLVEFEKALGKFSDKIAIIVGLEMGGKIEKEDAYSMIKQEYKKLKKVYKEI